MEARKYQICLETIKASISDQESVIELLVAGKEALPFVYFYRMLKAEMMILQSYREELMALIGEQDEYED